MLFDHGLIKKHESGKAIKYRSVGTGPITQCRRPAQDNHPFLPESRQPVERLFVPQCL
jgi:hypothetical protein